MMKCLSVRDFLSSLSALTFRESFIMLFWVANGNVDVIEMEVLLWKSGDGGRGWTWHTPLKSPKSRPSPPRRLPRWIWFGLDDRDLS